MSYWTDPYGIWKTYIKTSSQISKSHSRRPQQHEQRIWTAKIFGFNPFQNGVFPKLLHCFTNSSHLHHHHRRASTGLCAWEELHSCTSPCKVHVSSHSSSAFITLIKYQFGCTFCDSHSATFWCRAESWYGTILQQIFFLGLDLFQDRAQHGSLEIQIQLLWSPNISSPFLTMHKCLWSAVVDTDTSPPCSLLQVKQKSPFQKETED